MELPTRRAALTALFLLAACSDKKPNPIVEPPTPEPPHTLSVVAGEGVAVSPQPGSYPAGTVVQYTVTSLPGYGAPDVVVDSLVGAANGSVTMSSDHVLLASAPLAPTAVPATDPVRAAARQVVTATDPVAAYAAYLGAVADLAARVSDDSTRRHVSAANRLAFDWVADSAAIMRADAALAGKVFALGEAPLPGAGRAAAAAASDARVKTAYVFTNGIFNGPGGALDGMLAMAAAARQSGHRLTTLGDGATPGGGSPRVVYLLNYNRSTNTLLGAGVCTWKAVSGMVDRGTPYAVKLWRMSGAQRELELGCTLRGDLFETISQLSRQLYGVPTAVPGDAARLAALANGWRTAGYNVVLTAHSQGNLMTSDALLSMAPLRAGGPTCMSFISIASPAFVPTPQAVPVDGVVIAHERARDFVLGIPGPKAAALSTGQARQLNDLMGWWTRILPAPQVTDLVVGLKLHLLASSYLGSTESRDWIMARFGSHYSRLADDCGGSVAARVVNGETRSPIAGAQVAVAGGATALANTPASGLFVTPRMQARPVDLVVSAPGYESVTLYGVEPLRLDTLSLAEIPLVKTDSVPGGISGVVRNARNLVAIPGALVTLRRGINATSGEVVASTRSITGGGYQITGVRAGTYTLTVEASGFISETRTGIVIGSRILPGQDVLLSPDDLDLRIKLTWGATPADLDSHLTGPQAAGGRFHVFWAAKGALEVDPFAALDVDDITSFGPETITVTRQAAGVYRYSVHDYTNGGSASSTALGASGAVVTVYLRGRIIATYAVPSAPGTLWTVFEIDNGVLRRINTMGYGTAFDRLPAGDARAMQPLPEKPVPEPPPVKP